MSTNTWSDCVFSTALVSQQYVIDIQDDTLKAVHFHLVHVEKMGPVKINFCLLRMLLKFG